MFLFFQIKIFKPFYGAVDFLYHETMKYLPEVMRNADSRISAFVLGYTGITLIVKGLQWTSKKIANRIIPNFDKDWLPRLEELCFVGMATSPLLFD